MKIAAVLCLFSLAFAYAQEVVVSPQAIIVNPEPAYDVEVFVDKDPSGEGTPSYEPGESIQIGVRVSEDAYVYLFNVESDGNIQQILPNNYDSSGQDNYLRAGQTKYFPPEGATYQFEVDGPEGLDKVIAVASREPLDTSQLADFEESGFASSNIGQEAFSERLSVIVEPLPQEDWTTDTALFYVGDGTSPAAPSYGTLFVTSSPEGARVYVDDRFVGTTPVRYGAEVGNHVVNVELEGYETYEATVNITGGETREVEVQLDAEERLGQAVFESSPSGAEVYVDGQFVGTTPTDVVSLAEGEHQARFAYAGFDDTYVTFTVEDGGFERVSAELRSQVGTLVLRGNVGGANVFIDGLRVGTIPSGSGLLTLEDLSAGTHQITVTAPGFNTYLGEFEILPGETTELRISQSRR